MNVTILKYCRTSPLRHLYWRETSIQGTHLALKPWLTTKRMGNLKCTLITIMMSAFRNWTSSLKSMWNFNTQYPRDKFIKVLFIHYECTRFWGRIKITKANKYCLFGIIYKQWESIFFRDAVRYHFTHEILSEDESVWKGQVVPRDRRVSLILRCQPLSNEG